MRLCNNNKNYYALSPSTRIKNHKLVNDAGVLGNISELYINDFLYIWDLNHYKHDDFTLLKEEFTKKRTKTEEDPEESICYTRFKQLGNSMERGRCLFAFRNKNLFKCNFAYLSIIAYIFKKFNTL